MVSGVERGRSAAGSTYMGAADTLATPLAMVKDKQELTGRDYDINQSFSHLLFVVYENNNFK